jgi:hypothetical protein
MVLLAKDNVKSFFCLVDLIVPVSIYGVTMLSVIVQNDTQHNGQTWTLSRILFLYLVEYLLPPLVFYNLIGLTTADYKLGRFSK